MNTAFPPHRIHSSIRITPTDAAALLYAYLENATTDLSLHPNAILSENGPITPYTGSDTGLVLHNLRRLEAGLRGEHIELDLDFSGNATSQQDVPMVNGIDHHQNGANTDLTNGVGQEEEEAEESGWQSIAEFEQEQSDVEGDLGDRGDHVVNGNIEGGEVQPRTVVRGDLDKEARKKAKKERHKKLKREMEEKKRKEDSP